MRLRFTLLTLAGAAALFAATACDKVSPASDTPLTEQEKEALGMAENLKRTGNYEAAANVYRQLLTREYKSTAAYLGLSAIYRRQGRGEEAVSLMREAEKRYPADQDVLLELGYALIAANHPEEAVGVFDRLAAINHANVSAYNGKAVAFDRAGNHTAAQEIYQTALKLSPSSTIIQNNLALSMILNGQVDTAISLLEPVSRQPGVPATVRHNLALAYGVKGDYARARAINMEDMSARQADENEQFYVYYAQMLKKQQVETLSHDMQLDLPEEDTRPVMLTKAADTKAASKEKAKPAPKKATPAPAAASTTPSPEAKDEPSPSPAPQPPVTDDAPEPEASPAPTNSHFLGLPATANYPTSDKH